MNGKEAAALRDRLAKAETLAARGATPGERAAARSAVERIGRRLEMLGDSGPTRASAPPPQKEFRFTVRDQWGRQVFEAMCAMEGHSPYRRRFQRRSTFLVRLTDDFAARRLIARCRAVEKHLWRELDAVTKRVIRERVTGHGQ